jgi:dTDP-4-amino-4,6-dideoxygalactose transaminase
MRVERKADFIEKMKSKGIATSQVHNRNDKNSCVFAFRSELPNIDKLEKDLICLPVGWWIDENDIQYIIDSIKENW